MVDDEQVFVLEYEQTFAAKDPGGADRPDEEGAHMAIAAISQFPVVEPLDLGVPPGRHLRLVAPDLAGDPREPAPVARRPVHRARPVSRSVRRRRTVVGAVVVGLFGLLALPAGALGGHAPAPSTLATTDHGARYVVRPGDTLWSIATRLDPSGDPRVLVSRLSAQLGTDTVVPGEHLRLR